MPEKFKIPELQAMIGPYSVRWWQFHCEGDVTVVNWSDMDWVRIVMDASFIPVNGDKFTTCYGQKGAVAMMDDETNSVTSAL